jgi:hypothetical protein
VAEELVVVIWEAVEELGDWYIIPHFPFQQEHIPLQLVVVELVLMIMGVLQELDLMVAIVYLATH